MVLFRTPFAGYSVRFSPFDESRLAVGTAQNYGIIGNRKLHVLQVRRTDGFLLLLWGIDARHLTFERKKKKTLLS